MVQLMYNSVLVSGVWQMPQSCLTLGSLWTVARQAALSMVFSRGQCGHGFPALLQGTSRPRHQAWFSYVSPTGRQVLQPAPPGEVHDLFQILSDYRLKYIEHSSLLIQQALVYLLYISVCIC